jgi:hypothetical protein
LTHFSGAGAGHPIGGQHAAKAAGSMAVSSLSGLRQTNSSWIEGNSEALDNREA